MTRSLFPKRRTAFTVEFFYRQSGFKVSFSVFDFVTFRVGEIFLATDKTSNDLEAEARDAMILASFALQHGATIEEIRSAMTRDHAGECSSVAGYAIDTVWNAIEDLKKNADHA